MATDEDNGSEENTETAEVASGGAERERSGTRYPFYPLEEAEGFARAIQESGGNEVLEDELLKHLDLSRTTKSWVYKLSTAREFGLIDRRGRKNDARITITDLGRRLLQPGDEAELAASRQAAFLKPPLYGKLVERYRGAPVPAIKFLAGLLVREHKIVESVSEQAAEAFVASAKHAGFVSSNVIGEPRSNTVRPAREAPAPPSTDDIAARTPNAKTVPIPDGFIAHTFPLRRDLTVTIPLPVELTKRDVERLHKWMDTLIIEEDEHP